MARHLYALSPVVDGQPLLAEPGFWAAHLADLCEGFSAEDFATDAGDAGAALERLYDREAWPVFTVPLSGGFTVVVHYNSGDEATTSDYFLTHPDLVDLVLGSVDEDWIGPGLCWPELEAWLDAPAGRAGVLDRHERLLLLLPVLGDAEPPPRAVDLVVEALVATGAPDDCEVLARALLGGHPMWGAATWRFDADERSWICQGDHSPRREPLGRHLPEQHRAALERCLMPS